MEKTIEEEIERLAEEYGLEEPVVRRYFNLLSSSGLITDEETLATALEEAIQMAAPTTSWTLGHAEYKNSGRPAESVLSKTLSVVLGSDAASIAEDVESMLAQEAERAPSHHRGK